MSQLKNPIDNWIRLIRMPKHDNEVHRLVKENGELTERVHQALKENTRLTASANQAIQKRGYTAT